MSLTLHTSLGNLKLEVHCDRVPVAAYNFIALAASGAYDGTQFLRNIKGFVVQGGDPTGTGKGGECIWGGLMPDNFCSELKHDMRGVVSMASSKPDRVGSQFFITYAPQPHLDGVQTVVAKVISGWDTLDKMERVPVKGKKHRPEVSIILERVTIHANPFAEAGTIIAPPTERVDPDPVKKPRKKKKKCVDYS